MGTLKKAFVVGALLVSAISCVHHQREYPGSLAQFLSDTPGLALARERAKYVKAGMMQPFVLTGSDATDLIGADGLSFIIHLPQSAPENNRPYIGIQWFVNGKPVTNKVQYGGGYKEEYVERTRVWLVDVAVFRDQSPADFGRGKFAVRARSLMKYGGLNQRGPIEYPEGVAREPQSYFFFCGAVERSVDVGIDIPLGCWFQIPLADKTSVVPRDVLETAKKSPLACVFYIRLQKDEPER